MAAASSAVSGEAWIELAGGAEAEGSAHATDDGSASGHGLCGGVPSGRLLHSRGSG